MIHGVVDGWLQPRIEIPIRDVSGDFIQVGLKFDIGFNGELGLSSSTLDGLKKSFVAEKSTAFGNGQIEKLIEYEVECLIDGETEFLTALDLGQRGGHLLGMKALPLWKGSVEFRVNGDVIIEKMPPLLPSHSVREG